uniref:RxLR effector protein n=1 Tax=Mesocestoides corti TaxID=53468 RepID=A0A5K3G4I2_MESCO
MHSRFCFLASENGLQYDSPRNYRGYRRSVPYRFAWHNRGQTSLLLLRQRRRRGHREGGRGARRGRPALATQGPARRVLRRDRVHRESQQTRGSTPEAGQMSADWLFCTFNSLLLITLLQFNIIS